MYTKYLKDATIVIQHCNNIVSECDPLLRQKYAGFICVFSIATYELAIKNILINFCRKKHPLFGDFFESRFEKINARIEIERLNKDYLKHFGRIYSENFKEILDFEENKILSLKKISMKSAYQSLLTWRHAFAHSGTIPNTTTFDEVCSFYETGLSVIYCLDIALSYE